MAIWEPFRYTYRYAVAAAYPDRVPPPTTTSDSAPNVAVLFTADNPITIGLPVEVRVMEEPLMVLGVELVVVAVKTPVMA